MKLYKKAIDILTKIEDYILISFTSVLVFFAILQFVLTMFKHGILWFDSFIKYLVLWTGMIAANVATTNNKHIKIDIVGHWTKGKTKTGIYFAIYLFSTIICTTLFVLSIIYLVEIEFSSTDPSPFLNIPPWVLVLIIPITFGIMSLKFLAKAITCVYHFVKNEEYPIEKIEGEQLLHQTNQSNDTTPAG